MILFKYQAISEYFRTNLEEQQIWFSPPSEFNDIDDSALRIDWRLTDEDILNELEFERQLIYEAAIENKDYSNNPVLLEMQLETFYHSVLSDRGPDGTPDHSGVLRDAVTEGLEIRRQTIGISCFTQDNQNTLMWAHYADGHRGVCLGIETNFDSECFRQLEVVEYADTLPKIKLLAHMKANLIRLYTTKSSKWSYEREIRAFQHHYGKYRMNPRCLVNVILGLRVQSHNAQEIQDIVRRNYGHQVGMLQMIRGSEGELSFQPLGT